MRLSHRARKIAILAVLLVVGIAVSVFVAFPLLNSAPELERGSTGIAEGTRNFDVGRMPKADRFWLIQALVPGLERPGHVYVATFTGLVVGVNSSDFEYQFFYMNDERFEISGFIVHPEQPNVFYSFGHPAPDENTGIRRSEDRGQTWNLLTMRPDPHEWVVSRIRPEVMYAVDFPNPLLIKSEDGGLNWKVLESPSRVYSIGIDPQDEDVVLVGTETGLYISRDGGLSWDSASTEMANSLVSAVAYSPHDPQTIYARSFYGLFKSQDGGKSWHLTGSESLFLLELVRYIAVDNFSPNVVYAAAGDMIWKSLDGGENWVTIRKSD